MTLTRREFISKSAVILGSVGSGFGYGTKVLHSLVRDEVGIKESEEKIVTVFTPCAGCHQKCVLWAHVIDGRIIKTEAANFMDQPEDRHCCLKGLASAQLPYYPDRLKYPLRKTGARGEGKWERISWDMALDTIAEKLKETREKYGARAVLIDHTGSSVSPQCGDVNSGAEAFRFENLFGSTLPDGWYDDTASPVANFFTHGHDLEASDPRSLKYSNLILIWGANPAETAYRDWKHIGLAREKGTKLIAIGPLFDTTAAKADEFIPIRRATDAALALSMIQVIVENNLHDKIFLCTYTVAPLLVRVDNGQLLREADIQKGGSKEKFVVWDEAAGRPIVLDRAEFEIPARLALKGRFTINGIDCSTAFQKLVDAIDTEYKPEQASKLTGIPSPTIRDLAMRYAQAKPAAIYYNHGLGRYYHGNISMRAQLALGAVCGYLGQRGGGVNCGGVSIPGAGGGYPLRFNYKAVHKPTDASYHVLTLQETLQAIETGSPYPIKMWINSYRNPIHCCPNPQRWVDKIVPKLDFIVNINVRMDWTAEYADIVLPDATIFERLSLSGVMDHVVLSGPVIEPLFEARPTSWIWSELGKRFEFAEHFRYSAEDYVKMMLDGNDPSIQGITMERLREAGGIVRANVPETPYISLAHKNFDTPTGRIEFYAERLTEFHEELPLYKPSLEAPHSNKYPFQFLACHQKFYMQSFMGDLPVLRKFMKEPWADINQEDAKKKQIKDDDLIEVFNDRGGFVVKARINPMVPPGLIRTNHGPGRREFEKGHYQMVTLTHANGEAFNPVHDLRYQLTRPWWKWAGGQADIIFDCAVDIRKV